METKDSNAEASKPEQGAVSGSLREQSLEWFFSKSDIEKEELKDKHFSSEYISHDSNWGFHFTFGQIEEMYTKEQQQIEPNL